MIVIPMAGLSSRFLNAGIKTPKFLLPAFGKTLFEHSVGSFRAHFKSEPFLFILRKAQVDPATLETLIRHMGIADYSIAVLDHETAGQADTVRLGLAKAAVNDAEPLAIFNIDTILHEYTIPARRTQHDGMLDVFEGEGSNWSYVRTNDQNRVVETAEKRAISRFCSTGLYFFGTAGLFRTALQKSCDDAAYRNAEHYIAPVYNALVALNCDITIDLRNRDSVSFVGVPDEYVDFLLSGRKAPGDMDKLAGETSAKDAYATLLAFPQDRAKERLIATQYLERKFPDLNLGAR